MIQEIIAFTVKTIIIFIFMFLMTRILSKKAVAQLSPFEFIGIIILSDNIGVPIESQSIVTTLYGSFLIVALIIITGRLAMTPKLSPYLEEVPSVLMSDGKLDYKKLKAEYMPINQLLALVRNQGYNSLQVIDSIILEPNGNISIFPKPTERNITAKDLNLSPERCNFSIPVVLDGQLIKENLAHTKLTEEDLFEQINKAELKDYLLIEVTDDAKLGIFKK